MIIIFIEKGEIYHIDRKVYIQTKINYKTICHEHRTLLMVIFVDDISFFRIWNFHEQCVYERFDTGILGQLYFSSEFS